MFVIFRLGKSRELGKIKKITNLKISIFEQIMCQFLPPHPFKKTKIPKSIKIFIRPFFCSAF